MDSPCKGPIIWCFDVFVVRLYVLLNKQLSCWLTETPWHSCEVTVMNKENLQGFLKGITLWGTPCAFLVSGQIGRPILWPDLIEGSIIYHLCNGKIFFEPFSASPIIFTKSFSNDWICWWDLYFEWNWIGAALNLPEYMWKVSLQTILYIIKAECVWVKITEEAFQGPLLLTWINFIPSMDK